MVERQVEHGAGDFDSSEEVDPISRQRFGRFGPGVRLHCRETLAKATSLKLNALELAVLPTNREQRPLPNMRKAVLRTPAGWVRLSKVLVFSYCGDYIPLSAERPDGNIPFWGKATLDRMLPSVQG
jgi:hypothetical protein